jgi:hypothetical protein
MYPQSFNPTLSVERTELLMARVTESCRVLLREIKQDGMKQHVTLPQYERWVGV